MKKYPAIAAIEFKDISVGFYTTDAMLKKAPIDLLKSGAISHGRFLTLIAGTTASVDESYREGLDRGKGSIVDNVILVDVHSDVHDALLGKRNPCRPDAMAILETKTVSSNLMAAELALKGTDVRLIEIRIADSLLSGKGLSIYQGQLPEIESAIEIANSFLTARGVDVSTRIIPSPHEGLLAQVNYSTNFKEAEFIELDGEGI